MVMNKLKFFCGFCVSSFFLFSTGISVGVSGKPAPSGTGTAIPTKNSKEDANKSGKVNSTNQKSTVTASITAGSPAADGSSSSDALTKDSKKSKENPSEDSGNKNAVMLDPSKQASSSKKKNTSGSSKGAESTSKNKYVNTKKPHLDETAAVNAGAENEDHAPSSWSVESDKSEDTPDDFTSMQQQPDGKKEALDDAKWLLYGGIGLVVFSILGMAFFVIFLIKKKRSKNSFGIYGNEEWS